MCSGSCRSPRWWCGRAPGGPNRTMPATLQKCVSGPCPLTTVAHLLGPHTITFLQVLIATATGPIYGWIAQRIYRVLFGLDISASEHSISFHVRLTSAPIPRVLFGRHACSYALENPPVRHPILTHPHSERGAHGGAGRCRVVPCGLNASALAPPHGPTEQAPPNVLPNHIHRPNTSTSTSTMLRNILLLSNFLLAAMVHTDAKVRCNLLSENGAPSWDHLPKKRDMVNSLYPHINIHHNPAYLLLLPELYKWCPFHPYLPQIIWSPITDLLPPPKDQNTKVASINAIQGPTNTNVFFSVLVSRRRALRCGRP
jgi:hypothetical protein